MTNLVSSVIQSLEISGKCWTEQEMKRTLETMKSEAVSSFSSMIGYFVGAGVLVLLLKCFI